MNEIKRGIPQYVIVKKDTDNTHITYVDTDTLIETMDCTKALIYSEERAEEILNSMLNAEDYEIVVGYLSFPNN